MQRHSFFFLYTTYKVLVLHGLGVVSDINNNVNLIEMD